MSETFHHNLQRRVQRGDIAASFKAGGLSAGVRETRSTNRLKRVREILRQGLAERQLRKQRKIDRLRRRRAATTDIDIALHWERLIAKMLTLGNASVGNSVRMFCDGDICFERIWEAIETASTSVWMEAYTFEPDKVGLRTLEVLAQAAKRGCDVLLLVDAVGSSTLTESHLKPLREAGATVHVFNPLFSWRHPIPLLKRDHRKITIIDHALAFCGGMNISADYAGDRHGNCMFKDCHAELHGPCVRDLAKVLQDSVRVVDVQWPVMKGLPAAPKEQGDSFVQVLASSGLHGRRGIQRALRLTIRHSVRHCYITTPYFLPPLRLMRAITRAARRGVDVRILTAGNCDVPMVRVAAQHIYGHFLRNGVRIFEVFDSTLHAKTITVDGVYCSVGSFNLDTWSDRRNLEANVAVVDPAIARELQEQFMADAARGCEVTLENWKNRSIWRRTWHWCAYQVMRI